MTHNAKYVGIDLTKALGEIRDWAIAIEDRSVSATDEKDEYWRGINTGRTEVAKDLQDLVWEILVRHANTKGN